MDEEEDDEVEGVKEDEDDDNKEKVEVMYKHAKGDQKIPSTVAELCVWWNETKNRASPHCSPNNSDGKEEEDVDDKEGGEMGTTGLVFGHDESKDESDD